MRGESRGSLSSSMPRNNSAPLHHIAVFLVLLAGGEDTDGCVGAGGGDEGGGYEGNW